MNSKKWMVAALGVAMVGGAAGRVEWRPRSAQAAEAKENANPYRAVAKAKFDALAGQFNLSDGQRKSVGTVLGAAFLEGLALHEDAKLSPEQKRAKARALHSATREKIGKLLTPEQTATAQKLFAERKERVKDTLREIADELQLTEAQRGEVRPILTDAVAQARAIIFSATTLPQKRTRLVQLRQTTREKLASILTPEQLGKLDQMRDAVRAELAARLRALGLPAGPMVG